MPQTASIESLLSGGHPNSLGNTLSVVDMVRAHPKKFDELFNCYFSADEVVRLRTSNAIKRLATENRALLVPYIEPLFTTVARIQQASTQWTLAILYDLLIDDMSAAQLARATKHLQHNLAQHSDWIVLNNTMETLTTWAKTDHTLKRWLLPHLRRLSRDERKSVAKRALQFTQALAP